MCAGSLNALHAALSIAGAGPPRGALSTVTRNQKERQGQRRALPPLSEEQDGFGSPLALSLRQTPAGAAQAETAAVSRKPDDDGHAEGRAKAMQGNPHDAKNGMGESLPRWSSTGWILFGVGGRCLTIHISQFTIEHVRELSQ